VRLLRYPEQRWLILGFSVFAGFMAVLAAVLFLAPTFTSGLALVLVALLIFATVEWYISRQIGREVRKWRDGL